MKALEKRLRRLENSWAQQIATRQTFNAKQILRERIETIAARLRAAGHSTPESGLEADAMLLHIKQRVAQILACRGR